MTLTRTGLTRRKELARGGRLNPFSDERLAAFAAVGRVPTSTLDTVTPKTPASAKPARRATDTGPDTTTRAVVRKRSGGCCEWPGCGRAQDHTHHRLNRKAGGRHGEARTRLNGAAWLLAICWVHHEIVTNPPENMTEVVERMGWVLREHQDAAQVEVFTRHDVDPVFLTPAGTWVRYEDVAA